MTSVKWIAGTVDIEIEPQTDSKTFTFVDETTLVALNMAGTWVGKVRNVNAANTDTVALTLTVGTASAASGIITLSFTEAALSALIPSGGLKYEGVYELQKDTVPYLRGRFVVTQKASR